MKYINKQLTSAIHHLSIIIFPLIHFTVTSYNIMLSAFGQPPLKTSVIIAGIIKPVYNRALEHILFGSTSDTTSIKNHFYKMKRDIGMADYEKLVKQEFHTPSIEFHTPSLYLCFFIIGAEQDAAEQSGFMEDSYIKKQRYRDGVWNSMDGVWNSCFTSFS